MALQVPPGGQRSRPLRFRMLPLVELAIFAASAAWCRSFWAAVCVGSVPGFAAYVLMRRPDWLGRLAWRHAAYALTLAGLVAAYLVATAASSRELAVRWSELPTALWFLAWLHIAVFSMDRVVAACLRGLAGKARTASRFRRPVMAAVRVAVLVLVGVPLVASSVLTHWVEFNEVPAEPGLAPAGCQAVDIPTTDGGRLQAWRLPSTAGPSDATVLVVGGRGMTQARMLPYASMLQGRGYDVLVVRMREQRAAGGHVRAFGADGAEDVMAAVRYVEQRHPHASRYVAALGVSEGAAAVLAAAARDSRIGAVVLDSPIVSPFAEAEPVAGLLPGPAEGYFRAATLLLASLQTGHNFLWGPEGEIAQIAPRPVLLVRGGRDRSAGTEEAAGLYCRAGQPVMMWTVPGAGHAEGLLADRGRYERAVCDTLDRVRQGLPPFGWAGT